MIHKIPKKYQHLCPKKSVDFGSVYGNRSFTKHSYLSLSDTEKHHLIEDAVSYYSNRGFPYPSYSEGIRRKDFNSLVNKTISGDFRPTKEGTSICNHFFGHRYEASRYDKKPMKIWTDPVKIRKFMENRFKHFNTPFTDTTIRTGIALKGLPANFSPSIARRIYDDYLPDKGSTLDFSAGYGGRLIGFLASKKGIKYVGVEPLSKSAKALHAMKDDVLRWSPKKPAVQILQAPFEDVNLGRSSFDLIFSSPPYFKMERYGEEETQSCVRYPEYSVWIEKFWEVVLRKSWKHLKLGGHLIFSLTDYGGYQIIKDTMRITNDIGYEKIDELSILYHNVYRNRDKKERIFVFRR